MGLHPLLQVILRYTVQQFALHPIDAWISGFQVFAGFLNTATARGGKGDNGLSLEIVGFHEGVDNRWTCVPPDGEININHTIVLHVCEFVGITPS